MILKLNSYYSHLHFIFLLKDYFFTTVGTQLLQIQLILSGIHNEFIYIKENIRRI